MANKKSVIDLFAGVGGLSLGATRAGFNLRCAVELDTKAVESHSLNFPNAKHIAENVKTIDGIRLLREAGIAKGELGGLIGGPPCQGFSVMGHKAAADPRNSLLVDFFRLVAETAPAFFLAENVPGVLSDRNKVVLSRARSKIPKRYVMLEPFEVKASDYGAPTSRTRIFFYGFDPERVSPLKVSDFRPSGIVDVRVREALSSLPAVRPHWQKEHQGWRSVGTLKKSQFSSAISDRIPAGVGDAQAIERLKKKGEVSGFLGTIHTSETIARFSILRPGESDAISRSMRLDPDGYCPTLRAGTGPERGSYQAVRPVHPTSPRVISPREAARLQGFPDWFQFHPTKWHSFRQIGNSVSPIAAEQLLKKVLQALG